VKFKEIASGYLFLEAPRVQGDAVWFSDPILGGLYRLGPSGITPYVTNKKAIAGACVDESGLIIHSEADGLGWLNPVSGVGGTLLDTIDGRKVGAINDIFPDGKGGLYFSTSHTGPHPYYEPPGTTDLYRLDPDGRTTLLWKGLRVGNGIGLSPDGSKLYVNESWNGMFSYDIAADGSLRNRQIFFEQDDCDGLAVDSQGMVWSAGFSSGAIYRIRPDGMLDKKIPVPVKTVLSVCFGGADLRDVYVATGGDDGLDMLMSGKSPPRKASLYHGRSDVTGLATPLTRFKISK
jgi:sugar lactone lactonase YvrE